MGILVALFGLLSICGVVTGQTSANTPEAVIARVIDSGSIEGYVYKVVGPMGDAAAVAVTRVVGERAMKPGEIDMVLLILMASFADPSQVENIADRSPKTALFVLRDLDYSTDNSALKGRIADARRYILEHSNKVPKP